MAANTVLRWIPGGRRFVSTDSTGHSVTLSAPGENFGMKPSELILSALAGCAAFDVVGILEKKKTPLSFLEAKVTAEQDESAPWAFRKIHLHFLLKGEGLSAKSVQQAIDLSEEKYCSVAATLRDVAEISTSFEILEG